MNETVHTTWQLSCPGPLPGWLVALTGLLAAVAVCWLLRHELRRRHARGAVRWLYVLRVAIVALLALLVAQPVLSLRTERARPAPLLVLPDASDSMLFADAWAGSELLDLAAVTGQPVAGRETRPHVAAARLATAQAELARHGDALRTLLDQLAEGLPWGESFSATLTAAQEAATALQRQVREQRAALAELEARMRAASDPAQPAEVPPFTPAPFAAVDGVLAALDAVAPVLEGALAGEAASLGTLQPRWQAVGEALAAAVPALHELQASVDAVRWQRLPAAEQERLTALARQPRLALAEAAFARLAETHPTLPLQRPDWAAIAAATQPGTDLYGQLAVLLETPAGKAPLSGVIVISDGGQNLPARPEVLHGLRQRAIPVHTVGVGRRQPVPDVAIVDYRLPGVVRARREVPLELTLKTAVPAETTLELVVLAGEEVLLRRPLVASGEPETRLELAVRAPDEDRGPWTLRVATTPPDAAPANDAVRLAVLVVAKDERVLVVARAPRWDLVYLTRALGQLPTKLDTVYWGTLKEGEAVARGAGDGKLPDSASRLERYAAIVLDGPPFPGWQTSDAALFRGYAEAGGKLVLSMDEQGQVYGDLFGAAPGPAAPSGLVPAQAPPLPAVAIGADPARTLAAWRALAPPQRVAPVPSGDVPLLLDRAGRPSLTLAFVGRGRLYRLGVGDLFRLREGSGGPAVSRFLAAWAAELLAPVATATAPMVYPPLPIPGGTAWAQAPAGAADWTVRETATARPLAVLPATGTQPFAVPRQGALGWQHAEASPLPLPTALPVAAEGLVLNLQEEPLQSLAAAADGHYLPLARLDALPAQVQIQTATDVTFREIRLWHLPALLLLLAALLTLDWVLRRHCGLVL